MNQLTISSTFEDIYNHLHALNFNSFQFQITEDGKEKAIQFLNFCSSLFERIQQELPAKIFISETEIQVLNTHLVWHSNLSIYRFNILYQDLLKMSYTKRHNFFLGQYSEKNRKKGFVSLYYSHRPTNIVEKFMLPNQNLELKIVDAVIKKLTK